MIVIVIFMNPDLLGESCDLPPKFDLHHSGCSYTVCYIVLWCLVVLYQRGRVNSKALKRFMERKQKLETFDVL